MKKLLMIAVLFVAFSTVFAQQNCDKLMQENKELKAEIDSLELKLAQVTLIALASGGESNSEMSAEAMLMLMANSDSNSQDEGDAPFVTEAEALDYIDDHYSFYNRDYIYKGVKLRRVADNEFRVSLEECHRELVQYGSWDAEVKTLTVGSDGKYRVSGN